MIHVVGFVGTDKVVSLSPFCAKLDFYMRMTGLEYEYKLGDPRKSPTGKLPYITDNGTLVPDSRLAVEHVQKTHSIDLDKGLSDRDRALAHLLQRILEESFYFHILYACWQDSDGWAQFKGAMGAGFPPLMRPLIVPIARRMQIKNLHGQGTGRLDRDTISAMARDDLTAVANILGDNPFLLGDEPHTIDAVGFGFLQVVVDGTPSLLTPIIAEFPTLEAYCRRLAERYPLPA